jgi:hypothetical protein
MRVRSVEPDDDLPSALLSNCWAGVESVYVAGMRSSR